MTEKYNGWFIVTQREPYVDIITRNFKFGKYKWITAVIDQGLDDRFYYLRVLSSEPFDFQNVKIKMKSHNYHNLCDEGNTLLQNVFKETYTYLENVMTEIGE